MHGRVIERYICHFPSATIRTIPQKTRHTCFQVGARMVRIPGADQIFACQARGWLGFSNQKHKTTRRIIQRAYRLTSQKDVDNTQPVSWLYWLILCFIIWDTALYSTTISKSVTKLSNISYINRNFTVTDVYAYALLHLPRHFFCVPRRGIKRIQRRCIRSWVAAQHRPVSRTINVRLCFY